MKFNLTLFSVVMTLALLMSACAASPTDNAPDLKGTSWVLAQVQGKDIVPGSLPTISFEDGRVSGNASCNSFGGDYTQKGGKLTFGMMMSTMMACLDNGVMEQEQAYLAALNNVTSFKIVDGQLHLLDGDGNTVLHFSAQDSSFEGKDWELVSYNNLQGIYSLIADTHITATFADGKVNGSAGCNTYFADYTLDGDKVTFGPAGSTRMFCGEPEGLMQQETDFLAALGNVTSYRIQGNQLTFYDAEGRIALEFVPAN